MNHFKRMVLLGIMVCAALHAMAQRQLQLMDTANGVAIQNALIRDSASGVTAYTDERGLASLAHFPTGKLHLQVSRLGYNSKALDVDATALTALQTVIMQPGMLSLTAVTVSASRNFTNNVVSELDLSLRPIQNSQDFLRMVPGLFIGQHAGGGKAEQIFLRGFDIDHGTDVNISVDGIPVNLGSHAHGQGYSDLHFLIPELVHDISFTKGPYQPDRGNFATAGAVSFSTVDLLPKNFVKLEGGQYGNYRISTAFNVLRQENRSTPRGLYLAFEGASSRGYFDYPQDFLRMNMVAKYHQQLNAASTLTISASQFASKWLASGQIPERAVAAGQIGFFGAIDPTEGGKTSRQNLSVKFTTVHNDHTRWSHQLFASHYAFELYSNFTFFLTDSLNGDQVRQKENRYILGYNGKFNKSTRIFGKAAGLEIGLQLRGDEVLRSELSHTKDRNITLNPITLGSVGEWSAGTYASTQLSLAPNLELVTALRADLFGNRYNDDLTSANYKATTVVFSPKLQLRYQANRKMLLYLYGGSGFHTNDARRAISQPEAPLAPTAWGGDLGMIVKPTTQTILQIAAWYLRMEDELVYVGDEGIVEPHGATKRMGLDLSLRQQFGPLVFADLDFTFAEPRSIAAPKGQDYLPLAPIVTGTGGITVRQEIGWSGSLRYRFMGSRPANEDNSIRAAGYFVMDALVNYSCKKITLTAGIQNLLNTRWKETQFATESRLANETSPVEEIHFTPGTPFSIKFGINYAF